MQLNEKIAIAAVVVSVFAIIISALISLRNHRAQFRESIRVDISRLKNQGDVVHVYSVKRDEKKGPLVYQIGKWFKFRIRNNSSIPVSIIDLSFLQRHHRKKLKGTLRPNLVHAVSFHPKGLKLKGKVSLPFKLDVGEVLEFYGLLPIAINPELGRLYLSWMRGRGPSLGSIIEMWLFKEKIIEDSNDQITTSFRGSLFWQYFADQGVLLKQIGFRSITISRPLFERKGRRLKFMDSPKMAEDGFKYCSAQFLNTKLHEYEIVHSLKLGSIQNPMSRKYRVEVETTSGRLYYNDLVLFDNGRRC